MAECEMEAMQQFGKLRKPHPISGALVPTRLETDYRSSCMESRGFKLDISTALKNHAIELNSNPDEDAELTWAPEYWARDFSRLLSFSK